MARVRVLTLNAGSSSLKASVRDVRASPPVLRAHVDRLGSPEASLTLDDEPARPLPGTLAAGFEAVADAVAARAPDPGAVVHRVVHGGPKHHRPTEVDDELIADLEALTPLAPLHQPAALDLLGRARSRWPGATHVACFDTGFHADLPEVSRRLPVSETLSGLGIRRYGFHGLAAQSVLAARPDLSNVVIAHLGSGCSVTAVGPDRTPLYTSMSFSPDSGMISSTRSGDLDPEILLYLIEQHGRSAADLREEVNRRSGLIGVSGGLRDLRDLISSTSPAARLAVDMFVASAAMTIAAAATTLDRWDALVFTGGVGEHAHEVRDRISARLRLDDIEVSVVPADEEAVMDGQARDLLGEG